MARQLENWLKAYLEFSSISEAPTTFHFWTGVSTLAGAVRAQVWMDQGYFRWVPNFYIVLVAPPGIVSKSTTISIGMNLLRELEGISFGPNVITWQALIQALAEANTTFELPDGEYMTMSPLTIASSEFGNFLNPHDREMIDVLVDLWDGQIGKFEKRTKTSGQDSIINPWINVIAATTPGWIQGNFPEYLIQGGFTSRTIFIYGDKKRHLSAYPKKEIPVEYSNLRKILVDELYHISQLSGEFQLTPDALEYGVKWYEEHNEKVSNLSPEDRFAGYQARKQTHIHKLAMIISVSKRDTLEITAEDLKEAETITTAVEKTSQHVFSKIGSQEVVAANRVVELVRRHTKIDSIQAFRQLVHSMSYNDFKAAVEAGRQSGMLSVHATGDSSRQLLMIKE